MFVGYILSVLTICLFNLVPLEWLCYRTHSHGVGVWTAGRREVISNAKNHWYWKTGDHSRETMGYTNWYHGEPNDSGGNEDCILMWKNRNYQWNDGTCDDYYCFICEKD